MINLVWIPNKNVDEMVDTNITIFIILYFGWCKKSVNDRPNVEIEIIPIVVNEIKLTNGLQYSK